MYCPSPWTKKIYDLMVEAGVRAELLFAKIQALGLETSAVEV